MIERINSFRITVAAICLLLVACNGEEGTIGEPGLNSLLVSIEESAGTNCVNGGLRIVSGLDMNNNGTLETNEITMTEFACNGLDAETTLTSFVNIPSGMTCENGGIQLNMGIDGNGNAILDESEIRSTVSLCNGNSGTTIVTRLTNLANAESCGLGGVRIEWGVDTNGNGELDSEEITNSSTICNGEQGNKSLVTITNNGTLENCFQGGVVIQSGVDANGDNSLQEEEIEITRTVCNGIDGRVNEEIRIALLLIAGSSSGFRSGFAVDVLDFDIRDWENATETFLSATIRTSNVTSTATAELTDLFGNVIANSEVSTNDTEFQTLLSDNFFDNVPNQEITLRLRLRSELPDELIWVTSKTELIIIQQQP